jgi:spore coat protein U-like protein
VRTERWRYAAALAGALMPALAPAATLCSSSNVALSFGPYLAITASPLDAQSNLVVTCTRQVSPPGDVGPAKTTISVALGASQGSNSIQNRQMFRGGGADLLNYNVYLDSGRISVWGNTTGVDTASRTINVPNRGTASATFTFYGRIFALQNVTPGTYSDSLLVTVDY